VIFDKIQRYQKPYINGFKGKIIKVVEKKQLIVLFFQIVVDIASKGRYYMSIVV